ncbi:hypothetical protein ACU6U9_22430 [Pseudomonas sp. HK3]
MKLLLFTLLYSFSGILFAGNYVVSDVAISESLSAACANDALTAKGDKQDSNDVDDVKSQQIDTHLWTFHFIQLVSVYTKTNRQFHYFYHTRAPPFIA